MTRALTPRTRRLLREDKKARSESARWRRAGRRRARRVPGRARRGGAELRPSGERGAVARRREGRHGLVEIPDLAEQGGQPGVPCSPSHQHLRVAVMEGAQFREAPDKAGEMLGVFRVVDLRVLVEDAQQRLLQLFYVPLVPQERAI